MNTSKHHPRPLAAVLIENFSVFRFSFTQTNNYLSLGLFIFASFASVSHRPTIIVSHANNNLLLGLFIFTIIIANSHFTTNSTESQCSAVISIISYGQLISKYDIKGIKPDQVNSANLLFEFRSFARGRSIRMIICKKSIHPDDQLQEASPFG